MQLGAFQSPLKTRPAHNDDQLGMYGNLVYAVPGLTAAQLPNYFKDASFGVKPSDVASTYSPRGDVTVVRDKGFGVPHVYGSTRQGTMFGLGYVAAQDRLFFIDVLRHLGRAQLSSFAGGAQGNRDFDHTEWAIAPTPRPTSRSRSTSSRCSTEPRARRSWTTRSTTSPGSTSTSPRQTTDPTNKRPGEYYAINQPQGPAPWKTTDIIATAALVGGIFGGGGGGELQSAQVLQALQKRLGKAKGHGVWRDFRSADDPEAPSTVVGKRFPYQVPPKKLAKGSLAMPDRGSVKYQPVNSAGAASAASPAGTAAASVRPCPPTGLVCLPRGNSNALVVSARGVAVRPPAGRLRPADRLLRPADPDGGGHPRAGHRRPRRRVPRRQPLRAARPRPRLRVERHVGGRRPHGHLRPAAVQRRRLEALAPVRPLPVPRQVPPDGGSRSDQHVGLQRRRPDSPRLRDAPRSAYGDGPRNRTRATIKGKPVAYTSLRSTYMHEVDSARGFVDFNNPAKMGSPQAFQHAATKVGYTFNWLYVNSTQDAYFNSALTPLRARTRARTSRSGATSGSSSGRAGTPATAPRSSARSGCIRRRSTSAS